MLSHPRSWPVWPFLPLVRRRSATDIDHGLLYDFLGTSGRTGFGATVLLGNLLLVPRTEDGLSRLAAGGLGHAGGDRCGRLAG